MRKNQSTIVLSAVHSSTPPPVSCRPREECQIEATRTPESCCYPLLVVNSFPRFPCRSDNLPRFTQLLLLRPIRNGLTSLSRLSDRENRVKGSQARSPEEKTRALETGVNPKDVSDVMCLEDRFKGETRGRGVRYKRAAGRKSEGSGYLVRSGVNKHSSLTRSLPCPVSQFLVACRVGRNIPLVFLLRAPNFLPLLPTYTDTLFSTTLATHNSPASYPPTRSETSTPPHFVHRERPTFVRPSGREPRSTFP
jgi:hypothetical protein